MSEPDWPDTLADIKKAYWDGYNNGSINEGLRCKKIAMDQPFFPDTILGTRQGWIKAEIARKILERVEKLR